MDITDKNNEKKIDECVINCRNFRKDCQQKSLQIDSDLIKKLDEIKDVMNTLFLKLSVQVAKLEVDKIREI